MRKLVLTTVVIDMWHQVHGRHQLGTSLRVKKIELILHGKLEATVPTFINVIAHQSFAMVIRSYHSLTNGCSLKTF